MPDSLPVETCRFGPLTIAFDQRVLRPRPWTLLQAEWAAELSPRLPDGRLVEVCAGAGQIGLAAAAMSGRRALLLDADPAAVEFARANAAEAGPAVVAETRRYELGEPLEPPETFPLVLADPPYLTSRQTSAWPEDPRSAIDGGPDGLRLIRACLDFAARHMPTGGAMLLQTAGRGQNAEIQALLDRSRPTTDLECVEERYHDDQRSVLLFQRTASSE